MKKFISFVGLALVVLVMGGCGATSKVDISQEGGLVPVAPATENVPAVNTPTTDNAPSAVTPQTPAVKDNTVKASNKTISIKNFVFSPATITIAKGTIVTWVNNDSAPHQIKSDSFESAILNQGQSFSFTFNQTGSFNYICSIHPSMSGNITVQ